MGSTSERYETVGMRLEKLTLFDKDQTFFMIALLRQQIVDEQLKR